MGGKSEGPVPVGPVNVGHAQVNIVRADLTSAVRKRREDLEFELRPSLDNRLTNTSCGVGNCRQLTSTACENDQHQAP